MLYAQMQGVSSLRELINCMDIFRGGINHFGLKRLPARSALAHANEHRSYEVFEKIFYALIPLVSRTREASPHGKPELNFKFKENVCHFDSSTIDLCHSLYDWAEYRRTKGGIKVRLLLEHNACLPARARVSNAADHDQKVMETVDPVSGLRRGSYVCLDRGYLVFAMFALWTKKGISFVIRAKRNMSYEVVESRPIPNKVGRPLKNDDGPNFTFASDDDKEIMPIDGGDAAKLVRKTVKENGEALETAILKDEILKFQSDTSSKGYPDNLMLVTVITVYGKGNNIKRRIMSFLTNNMTLSSVTIANLYCAGWQIEAFFKLTKQNLRLNEFFGTSRDAVKTQIYIALIALLLLRYWQATFKERWSLRQMLAVIRSLLREYRGLGAWTDRATPDCGDRKKADNRDGPDGRPPCRPPNLFAGKQGWTSCHSPSRGRPGILDSRPFFQPGGVGIEIGIFDRSGGLFSLLQAPAHVFLGDANA
jgi:hypothetical protein